MSIYRLILIVFAIACALSARAQNYPLYNGYFINPFIYNPAAAATDRLEINASYRRQWFGIKGAPSISTLTANTLLDGTRAGIGFKVSSFSRGFLNSTDVAATYAYGVPLDKNNRLSFGLSAGVLSNMIDLNDMAMVSDPALTTVANSMIPSASFGMLLRNSSGFSFGVSLPKLVQSENLDTQYSFSYFDNIIGTLSFSKWDPHPKAAKKGKSRSSRGKGKKATNVPLEMFGLYRYSTFGSSFELTGKFNFNTNLWMSATYRQNQGLVPGIGIVSDNISFSYFYEPGFGGDLPLQTHEALLSVRLGKVNKFRDIPPPPAKTTTPVVTKKPEPIKKVEPVKKEEPPVQAVDTAALRRAHEEERRLLEQHLDDHAEGKHDDTHSEPVNERHDFVKRGTHREELDATNYVIAGAFQSRSNAEHYAKNLRTMGLTADFGHVSARNYWYVFVAEDPDVTAARKERDRLHKYLILKDVWLLTVQE